MGRREVRQFGDQVRTGPGGQVRVHAVLHGVEAHALQPDPLGFERPDPVELVERPSPPQFERSAKPFARGRDRALGQRRVPLPGEPLEPDRVDAVRFQQHVSRRAGGDQPGQRAHTPAQPGGVGPDRPLGVRRCIRSPQLRHEHADADRRARVRREQRQHRPQPRPAGIQFPAGDFDLERAQHANALVRHPLPRHPASTHPSSAAMRVQSCGTGIRRRREGRANCRSVRRGRRRSAARRCCCRPRAATPDSRRTVHRARRGSGCSSRRPATGVPRSQADSGSRGTAGC